MDRDGTGPEEVTGPAPRDLVVMMGRLARLRDADVLTEEEFQRERVKVVDGWRPYGQPPSN